MSMPFVSSLPFSVTLAYRRMNGVKLRATSRIISVVSSQHHYLRLHIYDHGGTQKRKVGLMAAMAGAAAPARDGGFGAMHSV